MLCHLYQRPPRGPSHAVQRTAMQAQPRLRPRRTRCRRRRRRRARRQAAPRPWTHLETGSPGTQLDLRVPPRKEVHTARRAAPPPTDPHALRAHQPVRRHDQTAVVAWRTMHIGACGATRALWTLAGRGLPRAGTAGTGSRAARTPGAAAPCPAPPSRWRCAHRGGDRRPRARRPRGAVAHRTAPPNGARKDLPCGMPPLARPRCSGVAPSHCHSAAAKYAGELLLPPPPRSRARPRTMQATLCVPDGTRVRDPTGRHLCAHWTVRGAASPLCRAIRLAPRRALLALAASAGRHPQRATLQHTRPHPKTAKK